MSSPPASVTVVFETIEKKVPALKTLLNGLIGQMAPFSFRIVQEKIHAEPKISEGQDSRQDQPGNSERKRLGDEGERRRIPRVSREIPKQESGYERNSPSGSSRPVSSKKRRNLNPS